MYFKEFCLCCGHRVVRVVFIFFHLCIYLLIYCGLGDDDNNDDDDDERFVVMRATAGGEVLI
jgi:hypothetical protein